MEAPFGVLTRESSYSSHRGGERLVRNWDILDLSLVVQSQVVLDHRFEGLNDPLGVQWGQVLELAVVAVEGVY